MRINLERVAQRAVATFPLLSEEGSLRDQEKAAQHP
jgi:hypothetical protein